MATIAAAVSYWQHTDSLQSLIPQCRYAFDWWRMFSNTDVVNLARSARASANEALLAPEEVMVCGKNFTPLRLSFGSGLSSPASTGLSNVCMQKI